MYTERNKDEQKTITGTTGICPRIPKMNIEFSYKYIMMALVQVHELLHISGGLLEAVYILDHIFPKNYGVTWLLINLGALVVNYLFWNNGFALRVPI